MSGLSAESRSSPDDSSSCEERRSTHESCEPRAERIGGESRLLRLSEASGKEEVDLRVNGALTYLNLNVNQLSDEDSQFVLDGVAANTTLKEFTAYNNGAVDKNTRKKLRGFKK